MTRKRRTARQRARRDSNHEEIVCAFEGLGATWLDTFNIGGALDGVLGVAGIDQRVEIKNPNALRGKTQAMRLTDEEQITFDEWRGRPPIVVSTIEDAIQLVHLLRKEACTT
jgi:hypothetical protein